MTDAFTAVAILLMVLAVVGSVVPLMPGALLSIAGILVYWWSTGFSAPGPIFLATFVLVGLLAALTDYLAGSIAAKAGGASTRTSLIAGVAGIVGFFVLGPIGILVGVAGSVFVLEYAGGAGRDRSLRAAAFAVVGVVGSTAVQLVVTFSLLIAFVVALLV